jgi:exo-beta-1,3-glucanase (GH17 family)
MSQQQYGSQNYSDFSPPQTTTETTPGADNLGEAAAGGGINGIAMGVASANERESGAQALRDIQNWGSNGAGSPAGPPRGQPLAADASGTPFGDSYYDSPTPPRPIHTQPSYGSNAPLAAGAIPPPSALTASSSERSLPLGNRPSPPESVALYADNPYNRYSSSNLALAPQLGEINTTYADDDDDWGMGNTPMTTQQKRRSFVPFRPSRDESRETTPPAAGAAVAAGAGLHPTSNGSYKAVPGGSAGANGSATALAREKSDWMEDQDRSRRKRVTWMVGAIIVLVVVGAILGGILGTQLNKGGGEGHEEAQKAVEEDNKTELTKDSSEIKALMGNKDLHKVFPGVDYTPLNAQYPDCMHVKPSQNNITRDMAVLSQLTNAVRLYGTDCNQTEMVLEAIDRLELKDMKVWLGVWLGNNKTTNSRQVEHMHKLLDNYGPGRFKGIIIGNEVLYREDLTQSELMDIVTEARNDLKSKGSSLPVAVSDLGDNWTADMAKQVDIVMSNVHPFFAGVTAEVAAGWTWNFWQTHDVVLTQDDPDIKQIIAEVGWPTGGGNNCGAAQCSTKTEGSVASVDHLNTFMEDWVCPSLKNGTEYFW